jgi:hypothetical protein
VEDLNILAQSNVVNRHNSQGLVSRPAEPERFSFKADR